MKNYLLIASILFTISSISHAKYKLKETDVELVASKQSDESFCFAKLDFAHKQVEIIMKHSIKYQELIENLHDNKMLDSAAVALAFLGACSSIEVHREALKKSLTDDLICKDRSVDMDQQGLENKVNKIKSLETTETVCTFERCRSDFSGISDFSLVN